MSNVKPTDKLCSHAAPFAAINTLPPELLFDIFLLFAENTGFCDKRCCYDPSWIRITQVCRRWRQIAQAGTQLWSHIVFDPERPEVGQTMLRCSAGSATSIHAELDSEVAQLVKSALASSPNVRELDIRARQRQLEVLSQSLHQLEHFTLRIAKGDRVKTRVDLDPSYFSTKLRRLELFGIHPRLLAATAPAPSCPIINNSISPLSSFTELRHLFINLDGWRKYRVEDIPIIDFKNVEYLGIQGNALCCIDMLRAFRFPTTTRLFCALSHFDGAEPHADTLASLLTGHCERARDTRPIIVMQVEGYRESHNPVYPHNAFKVLCYDTKGRLLCDFRLVNVSEPFLADIWFLPLWRRLPVGDIGRLNLYNTDDIGEDIWMQRTTPFSRLVHVDIRFETSFFFNHFSVKEKPRILNLGQIPFSERAFLLFPALTYITFIDVDLAAGGHLRYTWNGREDGPYKYMDRRFSTFLLRFLKQRLDLGHPIKAVELHRCRNGTPGVLRNLSKVTRVSWKDLNEAVYPEQFLRMQQEVALQFGHEPVGGFVHIA